MCFTHIVPYDSVAFACACEMRISIRVHCSDGLSRQVYHCLARPLTCPTRTPPDAGHERNKRRGLTEGKLILYTEGQTTVFESRPAGVH